ncbi:hypothetical protein Tco_0136917, partial [Tanacetum coccineum]
MQQGDDELVGESDDEGVSETIFGDKPSSPCNNACNSSVKVVEHQYEDPFGIYDLLNKHPKGVAEVSDQSLSHLQGFTPKVSQQENNHNFVPEKENNHDYVPEKESSSKVHLKVMYNSQEVHVNESSSGDSTFNHSHKAHTGGSILEVLDDMIRVGQSMGYDVEGCSKDIERII